MIRAIGATRRFVFQSLLAEASFLAILGGALGITLAAFGSIFISKVDQRFPRYPIPLTIAVRI